MLDGCRPISAEVGPESATSGSLSTDVGAISAGNGEGHPAGRRNDIYSGASLERPGIGVVHVLGEARAALCKMSVKEARRWEAPGGGRSGSCSKRSIWGIAQEGGGQSQERGWPCCEAVAVVTRGSLPQSAEVGSMSA